MENAYSETIVEYRLTIMAKFYNGKISEEQYEKYFAKLAEWEEVNAQL